MWVAFARRALASAANCADVPGESGLGCECAQSGTLLFVLQYSPFSSFGSLWLSAWNSALRKLRSKAGFVAAVELSAPAGGRCTIH